MTDVAPPATAPGVEALAQRLSFGEVGVTVAGTPCATVPAERLGEAVTALLADDPQVGLADLTAGRCAPSGAPTTAVLQLRTGDGRRLQLTLTDADQPPSVAATWPAAAWLERELAESFRAAANEPEPVDEADAEVGAARVAIPDPSVATPWRLDLRAEVRRGRIVVASAHPGRVRSGFEGLAERRSYTQLPVLAETLNDQAPFAVGLAAVLAVEALLGSEPPQRCTWVRTALAEASRVAAHCACLANQLVADPGSWGEALAAREEAARFLAAASGRRWATGVHRVGGIAADLPEGAGGRVHALGVAVDRLRRTAERRTIGNRGWRRRFAAVAVLDVHAAAQASATGPVARAAGLDRDVRRDDGYLAYGEVDFTVPVGDAGDVVDRVRVRLEELGQSLAILRQCVDKSPAGPLLSAETPAPTTTPTGPAELVGHFELWMDGHGHRPASDAQVYVPTESADGELAFYLASDGTGKPARAHLRSPSLFHFQALPPLLAGVRRSRAQDVVASVNVVAPEMDR